MNRRSFFGFFPAALVGVAVGTPVVKAAWGENIPASEFWANVKLFCSFDSVQTEPSDHNTPALQSHIDSHLRIDLERLAKVQAELADYPGRAIVA